MSVESLEQKRKDEKKITLLLVLATFLIGGIMMASAYGLIQTEGEFVMECEWIMNDESSFKFSKYPTSGKDAKAMITEHKDFVDYTGIEFSASEPQKGFYVVGIFKDKELIQKYGIDKKGNLYEYDHVCTREEKIDLFEMIINAFALKGIPKMPMAEET